MQKTASKNIIPSGSYEFLNLAHNAITIRVQTSNCDISKQLKEHFEKTIQARGLKLVPMTHLKNTQKYSFNIRM